MADGRPNDALDDAKQMYEVNGGPAFPCIIQTPVRLRDGETVTIEMRDTAVAGVTKLDWFAAQAPPPPYDGSLVADKSPMKTQIARCARWAFDWAEAMLAESRRRQAAAQQTGGA